jgi:hypothetical protein
MQEWQKQLLKLRPYKTTVIHALQPCNPDSRIHFCSWFLQSVIEGEIDPQLTFFSDEAQFHLQGYINMQNNHHWSSQNPYLTHKVPLHPVKVGVRCAVSARRIVATVFFKETINCERYLHVERQHFNTSCDLLIVTTSFQTLSISRATSLAKLVCASWQAAPRSPWDQSTK